MDPVSQGHSTRKNPIYPRGLHVGFVVDFSDSSGGKECACNAGDAGVIPGSGISSGDTESHGSLLVKKAFKSVLPSPSSQPITLIQAILTGPLK